MADKLLRVKLFTVSLLEHKISHFRSFNSTRSVRSDENFGSSTINPDTALPNVKYLFFFIIAISLKVYLPPCV